MKIFICIASYRDPLLEFTITQAYQYAKYKDSLIFGVVEQCYDSEALNVNNINFKSQIRYLKIDPLYAKGVGFARHIAQTLWVNEEYYMQIDSHMMFDENWDETLINQFEDFKLYHKKPVITTYPSPFVVEDMESRTFVKQKLSGCIALRVNKSSAFANGEMFVGFEGHTLEYTKIHGYTVAGGFLFAAGQIVIDVPYDPFIYFYGEEQSLALRLWTHGYNIFHTNDVPIYHLYGHEHRVPIWGEKELEKLRPFKWWEYDKIAKEKLRKLVVGEETGAYKLGNERTLEQYIEWSGIDYFNKTINSNAITGMGVFDIHYTSPVP